MLQMFTAIAAESSDARAPPIRAFIPKLAKFFL